MVFSALLYLRRKTYCDVHTFANKFIPVPLKVHRTLPSNRSFETWKFNQRWVALFCRCWTSGWGSTKGTGFDKVLKQTSLPIVTKDRCDSFWPKQISYDVHLCAEDLSSGTCQGDSGGPLVCQGPDGRWTLYGATSFGHNTCFSSPSVFASVSFTVEWLCCHLDDYGPCSAVGCSLS